MKSDKSLYEFFTLVELLIFYLLIVYTAGMVIWIFDYLGCGIKYSLNEGAMDPGEVALVFLIKQAGIHLFFLFGISIYWFVVCTERIS
jgi:hypothetical protein